MAEDRPRIEQRVALVADDELERASGERVRLTAIGFVSLVNLRASPDNADFLDGVTRTLGVSPPLTPNRCNEDRGRSVLWLGPDEWLIIAADGEAGTIEAQLRATLADDPRLSIVDVSNNYTGFLLSGTSVRDALAKGCPLDLHPSVFGSGDCAQTVLARTRVLLRVTDDPYAIEIWARNSFARYTVEWLADALAEYRE